MTSTQHHTEKTQEHWTEFQSGTSNSLAVTSQLFDRPAIRRRELEIASVNLRAFATTFDRFTAAMITQGLGHVLRDVNKETVFCALTNAKSAALIGYMWAEPHTSPNHPHIEARVPCSPDIAVIISTAILPEYQGRGLVQILWSQMEPELKSRGHKQALRTATCRHGYADKIVKNLAGKVTINESIESGPLGLQRLIVSTL